MQSRTSARRWDSPAADARPFPGHRRRRARSRGVAVAVAVLWCLPLPASAGTHGMLIALRSGAAGLTISNPGSATLTGGVPGGSVSGQLGTVTVTDTSTLGLAWSAQVTTTTFTTGGGTAPETIGTTAVRYASGPGLGGTGIGVAVPGQATVTQAVPLGGSTVTAFSSAATVGGASVSWNPTLVIAIPAGAVVGSYTGTITHSVA